MRDGNLCYDAGFNIVLTKAVFTDLRKFVLVAKINALCNDYLKILTSLFEQ